MPKPAVPTVWPPHPAAPSHVRKTGFSFTPIPALSYSSDLGFQLGAILDAYWFGDGSTYPKYRHKLTAEACYYTKGSGIYYLFYDSEYLIRGLRFTASASYLPNTMMAFYGFNGYPAPFLRDKNAGFYAVDCNLLRILVDLQGLTSGARPNILASDRRRAVHGLRGGMHVDRRALRGLARLRLLLLGLARRARARQRRQHLIARHPLGRHQVVDIAWRFRVRVRRAGWRRVFYLFPVCAVHPANHTPAALRPRPFCAPFPLRPPALPGPGESAYRALPLPGSAHPVQWRAGARPLPALLSAAASNLPVEKAPYRISGLLPKGAVLRAQSPQAKGPVFR